MECGIRFQLFKCYLPNYVISNHVQIKKYSDCIKHIDTTEKADYLKWNNKLMKFTGTKMQKRYKLKNIKAVIKLNSNSAVYREFQATSDQFFTIKDVHNVGKEWKSKKRNSSMLSTGFNKV